MSVDLKTLTPDTTLPQTGFLFGADSQSAASPSVYPVANVKDAINSGITTLATGNAIIWDAAAAPVATVTLTQNATLYVNNFRAGGTYKLIVFQDATGGRTLAYDPNFKWPNDVIPTVSSGANAMTVFEFVSNGTYMYGTVSQAYDGSPAPTVLGLFAAPAGDYTTLSTLSSMPTGGLVTRAGQAMYYDSTGLLTYAPNNILLQSNTFTDAVWGGNTITVTGGVADPFGGTNAFTLTAAGAGAFLRQFVNPASSDKLINALWVRRRTGTGTVSLNSPNNSTNALSLTNSWQLFYSVSRPVGDGSTDARFQISITTSGDAIDVYAASQSRVTYETTPRAADRVVTTDAAYFGPRFDTDPATLQPKGLLVEGARTNLLTYSEQFDNAAWTKANLNTTGTPAWVNVATAPDGTLTADKLIEDANNTSHFANQNVTVVNGGTYTYSIYAKAAERSYLAIYCINTAASLNTFFNLSNGTVVSTSAGATSSIVSVGNGWYRCSVTTTTTAVTSGIYPGISANGTTATYLGDGTSGIFVWGAQIEAAAWASSYISTTNLAASRVADTFTLSGYANRLIEAYWIEQKTGVASSIPETVVSSGAVTINPPQFGWVTSLRAYQNAYAGDIATPSWIDNSGTTGNRMVTDSTGTLTWAPSNLFSNSASPSQTNTISAGIEGGGDYIVSYYGGGTLVLKQTNSAGAVITPSSTGTVSSRNYAKFTVPNGVSAVYIDFGAAATNAQLERVTYQTQPRALIETSGSAKFLPRYDFDAATTPASPRGMLIEEARTNLILRSEEFDNAAWTNTGASVTPNGVLSPDGRVTADNWFLNSGISITTASGGLFTSGITARVASSNTITLAATTHTLSWYVRAGSGLSHVQLRVGSAVNLTGTAYTTIVRLSDGFVAATDGTTVVTNAGNGWLRISLTFTPSAGAYYVGVWAWNDTSKTSNGTEFITLWGAQVEAGAFATSYIPTTTGTSLRVADVVRWTSAAFSQYWNASQGTIALENRWLGSGSYVYATRASDGSASNTISFVSNSGVSGARIRAGAADQADINSGVNLINATTRNVLAYKADDFAMSVNGGAAVKDTAGSVPTVDQFVLSSGDRWIRSFAYYNRRLPDATLQQKSVVGAAY